MTTISCLFRTELNSDPASALVGFIPSDFGKDRVSVLF